MNIWLNLHVIHVKCLLRVFSYNYLAIAGKLISETLSTNHHQRNLSNGHLIAMLLNNNQPIMTIAHGVTEIKSIVMSHAIVLKASYIYNSYCNYVYVLVIATIATVL